jgi:hypothetical protein
MGKKEKEKDKKHNGPHKPVKQAYNANRNQHPLPKPEVSSSVLRNR